MERFPNPENNDPLKDEVIEAWRENSPAAREKYARWVEIKENKIESETDPVERRLKQIKLNVERGDIFAQAENPDAAQDQYLDALMQLDQELSVPENDPLKIDSATLNELIRETEQKIDSL